MMLIVGLMVRSPNPIQDVQETVGTHKKNVITSQVLHLTITLQYNQLGQDGNRFQINGKCPAKINDIDFESALEEVRDESNHCTGCNRKFPMKE
jgi:hypothetical protein